MKVNSFVSPGHFHAQLHTHLVADPVFPDLELSLQRILKLPHRVHRVAEPPSHQQIALERYISVLVAGVLLLLTGLLALRPRADQFHTFQV